MQEGYGEEVAGRKGVFTKEVQAKMSPNSREFRRFSVILRSLLTMLSASMVITLAQAATLEIRWSLYSVEPINVSSSEREASRAPAMIAIPGLIIVAWEEEVSPDNTDIFFTRSTDGGASFSTPQQLTSSPGSSKEVTLAFRDSAIYAAWSEGIAGNKEILLATSFDLGQTFEEPLNVSQSAGDSQQPVLAVSNMGLLVAWADNTKDPLANPEGDFEILLRASQDGRTFTAAPANVSFTTGNSLRPAMATDGSTVFVVWEEEVMGVKEILFRQSTFFSFPLNVSRSPFQPSETPAIATTVGAQHVSIVWSEGIGSNTEIFYSEATQVGIPFSAPTFSTPYNISHTTNTPSRVPAIAVDSQGNAFIAWEEGYSTSTDVQCRRAPEIWLRTTLAPLVAPFNVSNSPCKASRAPVVTTDGLNAYVAWEEEIYEGKPEILFAKVPTVPNN